MGTSLCYCTFHSRHHPGWILWKKNHVRKPAWMMTWRHLTSLYFLIPHLSVIGFHSCRCVVHSNMLILVYVSLGCWILFIMTIMSFSRCSSQVLFSEKTRLFHALKWGNLHNVSTRNWRPTEGCLTFPHFCSGDVYISSSGNKKHRTPWFDRDFFDSLQFL